MWRRVVAIQVLLVSGYLSAADKALKPVPSAADQAKAEKLLKEVFKDEYAKTSAADKLAFAEKLFQQGIETQDDPATRYVVFREVRDLASRAGNLSLAFKAVDELAKDYAISVPAFKADAIGKVAATTTAAADAKALVELALPVINDAVMVDDYEVAGQIVQAAEMAAKKGKSLPLVGRSRPEARRSRSGRPRMPKYKPPKKS